MVKNTQKTWLSNRPKGKELASIKELITDRLKNANIQQEIKISSVITDFIVTGTIEGQSVKKKIRLLKELKPYTPSESGEWGVNPISALKNI
ncbi:hypothetical protein [Leeuwenhoekiella sp. MAR_2009_132]|uniref:hypothetical protein n=1 Tax=Leeuwenhoekiella sp. MAR_2009_132 TaxID=1392489 RepID=UPI00048E4EB3|nr:hypothetical protein [Leeuwenhoekiella sp. MAR_2009_132]